LALSPTLEGIGFPLQKLHNAEVKHGRVATTAITAIAVQEFATGVTCSRRVGGTFSAVEALKVICKANGKLACANCHLQDQAIDVRVFKASIEIPANTRSASSPSPTAARTR
jgi:tRNA A-37 threonylcarbamoyl transferase component Bud32